MALSHPRPFGGAPQQQAHAKAGAFVQRIRRADDANAVSGSSDIGGPEAARRFRKAVRFDDLAKSPEHSDPPFAVP
jgi:hypothetical protein